MGDLYEQKKKFYHPSFRMRAAQSHVSHYVLKLAAKIPTFKRVRSTQIQNTPTNKNRPLAEAQSLVRNPGEFVEEILQMIKDKK